MADPDHNRELLERIESKVDSIDAKADHLIAENLPHRMDIVERSQRWAFRLAISTLLGVIGLGVPLVI